MHSCVARVMVNRWSEITIFCVGLRPTDLSAKWYTLLILYKCQNYLHGFDHIKCGLPLFMEKVMDALWNITFWLWNITFWLRIVWSRF